MSAARTGGAARSDARRTGSHIGGRLRSVLVGPREGFRSSLRAGVAERASSSPLPAFLVFLGGAAAIVVYRRLLTLLRLNELPARSFEWAAFVSVLFLGALAGIGGYFLWARLGPRATTKLGGKASSERLRLVWAFADFPLAAYITLVLPLDLIVVGPEVFSTDRIEGSFAMVWAALSAALALSAAAWSGFLLWRGIEAAAGLRGAGTLAMMLVAGLCYVVVAAILIGVVALLGVFFT